jgi:hypothetical protein
MTVRFGDPKTALFGKTPLTKEILEGAFHIRTHLDFSALEQAIIETCQAYPVRHGRLTGDKKPVYQYRKKVKQKVVSYGATAKTKTDGSDIVLIPQWSLAPVTIKHGGEVYQVFKTVYAQMTSGKIHDVEEIEYFLNELERRLRLEDAQATIELTRGH